MAHVVQVYCPLEGSPHHRLLHVFACVHSDCVGQRCRCVSECPFSPWLSPHHSATSSPFNSYFSTFSFSCTLLLPSLPLLFLLHPSLLSRRCPLPLVPLLVFEGVDRVVTFLWVSLMFFQSWKVFRSQFLQMQEEYVQGSKLKQKEENNFAVKDWCEGAEDWGDDSESDLAPWITNDLLDSNVGDNFNVDEDRECMSQLQELTLDEALSDSHSFGHTIPAGEGHVLPSSSVPVFKPYYINVVDEEDYINFVDTNHAQKLLQEYRQREGIELELLIAQSFIFDNGEKYEKAVSESNDKIFYKFMKRISACREQILRYSWNGQPLFITCPSSDATEIPSCSNCGSCRVFEFQLMPALVSMLKNTLLDISVEFGTVLIYTCQKSCWPTNHQNPMEEFCIIQEDPDQMLFK